MRGFYIEIKIKFAKEFSELKLQVSRFFGFICLKKIDQTEIAVLETSYF